jgi:hypothetical protein
MLGRMTILKGLEQSDNCGVIKLLSQYSPGGTEEGHKNLLQQPAPWLRFELRISEIQAYNVTTIPTSEVSYS